MSVVVVVIDRWTDLRVIVLQTWMSVRSRECVLRRVRTRREATNAAVMKVMSGTRRTTDAEPPVSVKNDNSNHN